MVRFRSATVGTPFEVFTGKGVLCRHGLCQVGTSVGAAVTSAAISEDGAIEAARFSP
jgi:hypothetical protein